MSKIKIVNILAAALILSSCTQKPVILPPAPTPTIPAPKLLTWSDPAGFTFQYPEGTAINSHPEDNKNYANLTLTFLDNTQINIIMADKTPASPLKNKNIINTTLGGKTAQKYIENGQTTIYCEDNDVSVTITGADISAIADSWVFVYPTPTVGAAKKPATPAVSDDSSDVLEEY